jgi:hypothetical protein
MHSLFNFSAITGGIVQLESAYFLKGMTVVLSSGKSSASCSPNINSIASRVRLRTILAAK